MVSIDARGMHYKELNEMVKHFLEHGAREVKIKNVNGQRYIGDGLKGRGRIIIKGVPGNDLAAFMDGPVLEVHGNAQDGVGNTMNDGTVVIYGDARDTLGYAMRGGEIYILGDVGCRVGIHMKGFLDKVPVIVVGKKAGDFFAEYMAGGVQIVLGLGLEPGEKIVGNYCGTGMHGGVIYLRGEVDDSQLGKEVRVVPLEREDHAVLEKYVSRFADYFQKSKEEIYDKPFLKLIPYNKRPYGNMYAGW
ncbi:MAG: hypothetical protein QHH10_13730 [Peptococcaceae bacterium]|jgi:glutamate synthase domain-containing protein 3|nr:hypothetical protein [Peptococcaceae bacterium]MDH7526354.1 hypothetical protein [Peptococcaceae bacterium]